MPYSPVGGTASGSYAASGVRVVGASELAAEFLYRGTWARQRSRSIAIQVGKAVIEKARENASHRPGPEIVTGQYVESFYYEVDDNGLTASVRAGSDAPQALRLEYGFVGIDSLGRVYSQPPFPHWGPAIDEITNLWEDELVALTDFDMVMSGA